MWDNKSETLVYPKELSKFKNESLKVLNTTYMKAGNLSKAMGHEFLETLGVISLKYQQPIVFGLSTSDSDSNALTVCRTDPVVPTGIKTLNLMLDPSKISERNKTVEDAKTNWNTKFGNLNFAEAYEKLFELLWYSRLPCFDVKNVTSKQRDEMSIIKRCYWRSQLVDCATIFVARSTDRGMCCAFNVGNANEIYKSTKFRSYTERMQKKTKAESFSDVPEG